jgi:hypothetical protein
MITRLKARLTRLWQSKVWDTGLMALVALVALICIIKIWDSSRPISLAVLIGLWLFACAYWGKILWDYHHND